MTDAIAQLDRLTIIQRAVRDHFQQGGSIFGMFLVLAGAVGVVLLVMLLARRLQRREHPEIRDEPRELYAELLDELELTPAQHRFLLNLAMDLQLAQPTTVLLAPPRFDRSVETWVQRVSRQASKGEVPPAEFIKRLRTHLFPPVLARVGTQQMNA